MSDKDATQQGAEELQPAYSARASAISEIAKNVHAQNAGDFASFDENGAAVPTQPEQPEAEPQPNEPDEPEEQPAPEQAQPEDLEVIIVDGKEVKVKRDQLIEAGKRTLQKESAADRRLQEASETLRRAQAYERQAMQGRSSPDTAQETQMPSSDASNEDGRSTPEQRAIVREELWLSRADEAKDKFQTEFSDIVQDPLAMRLVVQLENERLATLAQQGTPLTGDPWKAYEEHGKKVREWLGKSKPTAPAVSEDKTERKRGTVTVVGSGARLPTPQPKKPLTPSESIEQMRLARQGRQIPMKR